MEWFFELRPIRFFSLYLAFIFVLSTALRFRQYRTILALVSRLRSRWPNLTQLVLAHRHIFLTWETLRPLIILLTLFLCNTLASQLIWPQAQQFRIADLLELWPAVPVVGASLLAMVLFDVWGTLRVGQVDQPMMEGYFDQAEYWLRGWQAPVVKFFTLGFVNPRKMVATEVATALGNATQLLNSTLWWVVIQAGLRIAFGLSLWGTYALSGWMHRHGLTWTP